LIFGGPRAKSKQETTDNHAVQLLRQKRVEISFIGLLVRSTSYDSNF
jgi:hypothetical protein